MSSRPFGTSSPSLAGEIGARRGKRAFDLLCAPLGLLLLSPFFIVAAVLIKAHDGGPVFFRQTRVGRHGRPFRMWKFRTMVVDAPACGSGLTVGHDSRITRPGRWLRRSKLDELPQLINVVVGEMSLVGPRPEVPQYVELYDHALRRVLKLTPGITDPASIAFRDEAVVLGGAADPEAFYIERIMPAKIQLNLDYARRATLWTDFLVILQTLLPRLPSPVRRPGR